MEFDSGVCPTCLLIILKNIRTFALLYKFIFVLRSRPWLDIYEQQMLHETSKCYENFEFFNSYALATNHLEIDLLVGRLVGLSV